MDTPVVVPTKASDALGQHVHDLFTKARDARRSSGIDAELTKASNQRRGEYTAEECQNFGGINVYANVTATKSRAADAWLTDILMSMKGRTWTVSSTPVPSISDDAKKAVVAQIQREIQEYTIPPDKVVAWAKDRAVTLKAVVDDQTLAEARKAELRLQTKIQDMLDEGGYDNALVEFIQDLTTYDYAVLCGPEVKQVKRLKWIDNELRPAFEAVLSYRRVSPFDFYWTGNATKIQEADVFEVLHLTPSALSDLKSAQNFNEEAIRTAIEEHQNGYEEPFIDNAARKNAEATSSTIERPATLDVVSAWVTVRGEMLKEFGVTNVEDHNYYHANVWCVDGLCIRAVLNPNPLDRHPYRVSSYEVHPGRIDGRGIPALMRDCQETINSSYRALRRNMGIASGPMAEVDATRVAAGQDVSEIKPAQVFLTTPDPAGGNNPVFRFHRIDSRAQELLLVIDHETRVADDRTGIPAIAYGNSAQSGGAARTVGGLALLLGNASKSLKAVISNLESRVIEPMLQDTVTHIMLYDTDQTLKFDAQVVARGLRGAVEKDSSVERMLQGLQTFTPYLQAGLVEKTGIQILLRDIGTALGFPMDKIIKDPEREAALRGAAQQQSQGQIRPPEPKTPAGAGQLDPAVRKELESPTVDQGSVGSPALDGRNAAALAGLNAISPNGQR